jgi:Ca2+-binding RTX toxin-like protein
VSFSFTDKNIAFPNYDAGIQSSWIYDPATGVLDPYMFLTDEDTPDSAFMSLNTVIFWRHDWSGSNLMDTEHGHWQLVPAIHNVDIFAGAGNDIILGGQGNETLDGGDGNDLIRASAGDDLILGGAGNDKLHAGVGNQTLTGGTGNDTIWGGTGTQILLGEQGRDIIYGGSGKQTLMGGAGNDLLWGGSGIQFLEGGDGSDVLHAGIGNETLSGGSGRDTFVFSAAAIEHDVVTDFHLGQDMITIAADFGALTIVQPRDLLPLISADAHGDAVLTVGSGFRLDLQHVAAQRVELHPSEFFRIA